MDRAKIRSHRWIFVVGLSLLVAGSAAASGGGADRLLLLPKVGSVLMVNPPVTGGGGFIGDLQRLRRDKVIGSFTTNILSEGTIFDLIEAVAMGATFLQAGLVEGSFETRRGTIYDQHTATLVSLDPALVAPVTPGYDKVVTVFADGVVTGGTRGFYDATGTSSLFLQIELDFDGGAPPILRAGTFLFTLD